MMERTLTYRFEMVDNVSKVAADGTAAQTGLGAAMDATTAKQNTQTLSFLKQMTALSGLRRGFSSLTSGLVELGLVSKDQAAAFMKMNAALGIFIGTAQLIKGVIALINMMRAAEVALAGVETYRAVLKNPAMMAVAIMGIGAAGAAAGFLAGKKSGSGGGGGTTVNQNLSFYGGDMTAHRGVARDSLSVMGGT